MLRRRYQPPESDRPDDDALPLDTVCTILTRQSTMMQRERNVFSAEVDPSILIGEAKRLGFAPDQIRMLDWDMGKGAYNTTIEDRPALHHWMTELLPSGTSRVVLVSQEDRLFRDRTEIQVNRFIEQVAQHRGWVVCGSRIYNFRREMDKEQFRLACKFGKQYIEFHIKQRLHPAKQRAAMSGRHVGGPVPWGYTVDYDPHSATYKHLERYAPHAELVSEYIFGRFFRMAHPTVTELARSWWRDGLVWSYFGPDVDERRVRWVESRCRRDEARGGYLFDSRQAQTIMTNMVYLGWVVRRGECAKDLATGMPAICHEPLVEPDVFWWCYDHILPERPAWAPARTTRVVSGYRPRRRVAEQPGEVRFLGQGYVRCAQHGRRLVPITEGHPPRIDLRCWVTHGYSFEMDTGCPTAPLHSVEEALCQTFVEQLTLDEQDLAALAAIAQRRDQGHERTTADLERQLAAERSRYEGAKRLAVQAPDLAEDLIADMRRSKQVLAELEARINTARTAESPSTQAWKLAQRATDLAERIRTTFSQWSRQAQARVLGLALDDAIVGRIDRHAIGLIIRWQGGAESRREIVLPNGHRLIWTPEEDAALQAHFHELTWEALGRMLPTRGRHAIRTRASDLKISRPHHGQFSEVVPLVVTGPSVANEMESYGFPVGGMGVEGNVGSSRLTIECPAHARLCPCARRLGRLCAGYRCCRQRTSCRPPQRRGGPLRVGAESSCRAYNWRCVRWC